MKAPIFALACLGFIMQALGQETAHRAVVGDLAPPLDLQMILQAPPNTHASWDALRGKVVVLEFWATWCGPCVANISHMNELTDAFKDQPVQFISVTDEDEATIKDFLDKKPIRGWVGLNTSRSMQRTYYVGGIPHTVIIGRDGKIAAITYPAHLEAKHLENVLAGKDSGLSSPTVEEDAPTVPALKETELPALFQFTIRRSKGDFGGWFSGSAGTSDVGPMHEEKALGVPLDRMLAAVHGITSSRLVIETPLPDGNFDFVARIPASIRKNRDSLAPSVIEGTFGLTSRRDMREVDAYVLTGKLNGAKGLRPTATPKTRSTSGGRGRVDAINTTMDSWASYLEPMLKKPVVNETGLMEGYDIEVRWKSAEDAAPEPSDLIEAVREQMGLTITLAKRPVEVVVVSKK
jgi:uncharacterized protein (TIGR03435 family)